MAAKDLRLETDGIRATSFERPRRIQPEAARQQCACGTWCHFDCGTYCGGDCDDYCSNQCIGDLDLQAMEMADPRAVASYTSAATVAYAENVCTD